MINTYSVTGFVGAIVLASFSHRTIHGRADEIRFGLLKVILRRTLFHGLLVGSVLLAALTLDSERGCKVLLGVAAYVAFEWMWSFAVWTFIGLRWLFTDRVAPDPRAVRSPLATWTKESVGADFELRFDEMTMSCESSYDECDGDTLYSIMKDAEKGWGDPQLTEGWTEYEWKNYHRQEFEVRRTHDGVWQCRPTYRYRKRQLAKASAEIREEGMGSFFAKETFEKLVGYTWDRWLNRETVPLPEGDHRPWQKIADEYAPSIETAYQRYVHQG